MPGLWEPPPPIARRRACKKRTVAHGLGQSPFPWHAQHSCGPHSKHVGQEKIYHCLPPARHSLMGVETHSSFADPRLKAKQV